MKRLGTDLTSAQKEMKAKHKAYENAVSILSRRLQQALTDKEAAEAELAKIKAQVLDGANSQALQVLLLLLLCLNKKNKYPCLISLVHKKSTHNEGYILILILSTKSCSYFEVGTLQLHLSKYGLIALSTRRS